MKCPNCSSEDVDSCRNDNCTACGWAQTTPVVEKCKHGVGCITMAPCNTCWAEANSYKPPAPCLCACHSPRGLPMVHDCCSKAVILLNDKPPAPELCVLCGGSGCPTDKCVRNKQPPAPEPVVNKVVYRYDCPQCGEVDEEHKQKPKTTVEDQIGRILNLKWALDYPKLKESLEKELRTLVELAKKEK